MAANFFKINSSIQSFEKDKFSACDKKLNVSYFGDIFIVCPGVGSLFIAGNTALAALAVVQIVRQDKLPAAGSQEETDTPTDTLVVLGR